MRYGSNRDRREKKQWKKAHILCLDSDTYF